MPSEKAKQLWYIQSNDETFQEFEKIEINDNLQLPDSTVIPNQSKSQQTTEPTENIDNANSPSEEVSEMPLRQSSRIQSRPKYL